MLQAFSLSVISFILQRQSFTAYFCCFDSFVLFTYNGVSWKRAFIRGFVDKSATGGIPED
jgi:hypothetical protein